MDRTIVVARPGIGETERKMILDAAAEAGYQVVFDADKNRDDMMSAEIIYGEGEAVGRAVAESDSLKWFCASFAGVDAYCKPGAFKNDQVILTNSAGSYGVSLAEHAIMLALMIMRQIPVFYDGITARKWIDPLPQAGIKDARVTLLGTGDVGRSLAKRIRGFEPECITGVSRSGKSGEKAFDAVGKTDRLGEVLKETDLLIISLPGTPETYHMIDRKMLSVMKPEAYLVNVGRGSVIDETALIEALRSGKLAGAALDVTETEPPLPDSPLWDIPNLLMTPHVAGNLTMEYTRKRNTEMFCEDLLRYAKGEPLLHEVDRRLGY